MGNAQMKSIAEFNDQFRKNIGLSHHSDINQFSEDNDPYGEHDVGSLMIENKKIFWKIDYYNKTYRNGSENPADTKKTNRVLTIMLACEY